MPTPQPFKRASFGIQQEIWFLKTRVFVQNVWFKMCHIKDSNRRLRNSNYWDIVKPGNQFNCHGCRVKLKLISAATNSFEWKWNFIVNGNNKLPANNNFALQKVIVLCKS